MDNCKWLGAIILSLTATLAQGAGIRSIDIGRASCRERVYGPV